MNLVDTFGRSKLKKYMVPTTFNYLSGKSKKKILEKREFLLYTSF